MKTPVALVVDGQREAAWDRAQAWPVAYFRGVEKPFDEQATVFRMMWDEENLYLLFECEDRYLNSSITERNGPTFLDDCAEIFIIPAEAPYDFHLGLEVNLHGVSNDFVFITNLPDGQFASVKSYDPDFEVGLKLDGTLNDNSDVDRGWTMEFAIPRALFLGLEKFSPMEAGNRWAFQALRQERNDPEIGRRVASTFFRCREATEMCMTRTRLACWNSWSSRWATTPQGMASCSCLIGKRCPAQVIAIRRGRRRIAAKPSPATPRITA